MTGDDTRPDCGCDQCQDVNVSNASNGLMQLVACPENEIDDFADAFAFIRDDLVARGYLDPEDEP